ncbi:MAG: hypothetical protein M0Z54_07925 [Thermaerobacter sp.]|nr:hypothetical protein [Thermaerobacter sp.]
MAIRTEEPEIEVRAYRRRFSTAYKLRILAEADACTEPGAIGALLRREGLYSSHLSTWRAQRAAGVSAALGQARGGGAKRPRRHTERARLTREVAQLHGDLARARDTIARNGSELHALARRGRPNNPREVQAILDDAWDQLRIRLSIAATCRTLGVPRSTLYSHRKPRASKPRPPRAIPPATARHRDVVLAALQNPRFAGAGRRAIFETLSAEGAYQASLSTFYRTIRRDRQKQPDALPH